MSKKIRTLPRTAEVDRWLKEHPRLRGWNLELVRKYRIKLSEVLEYQCHSDPKEPLVFVKHRLGIVSAEKVRENLEKEFRGLESLWNRAGASLEGTIPRPLAYLPEALAIAFEKLPGRNLDTLLKCEANRRTGRWQVRKFRKLSLGIGQWLRRYHDATAQPPDIHDSPIYLNKVSKWLNVCQEGGLDSAISGEVLDRVRCASDRVQGKEVLTAAMHGDLIPVNMLVDQGQVAVVDFGGYREREPIYEDLGMFLAHLILMGESNFYSHQVARSMAGGFLSGYACPVSMDLLSLYVMKAMLDMLACQFRASNRSWVKSRRLFRLETFVAAESRRLFSEHHDRDQQAVLRYILSDSF